VEFGKQLTPQKKIKKIIKKLHIQKKAFTFALALQK